MGPAAKKSRSFHTASGHQYLKDRERSQSPMISKTSASSAGIIHSGNTVLPTVSYSGTVFAFRVAFNSWSGFIPTIRVLLHLVGLRAYSFSWMRDSYPDLAKCGKSGVVSRSSITLRESRWRAPTPTDSASRRLDPESIGSVAKYHHQWVPRRCTLPHMNQ